MTRYFFYIFILLFVSCSSSKKGVDYSFFAAGHTYGSPNGTVEIHGLYEPFKDKIKYINNYKTIEIGFLLGDLVWKPNSWPDVQSDIKEFNMPIHVVRGNHDGKLKSFEEKFGKSYKKFFKNKDLFIILDPNLDNWNISGEQLVFLMNTLRNDAKKANNVFIMMHQLIWWTTNKHSKPFPNSLQGKSENVNYWSKIEPLLQNLEKPVFLYTGDVGAVSKEKRKKDHIIEYFYNKDHNITYIATGMGGGIRDNFIITDVNKDGTVSFNLIHLNGTNIDGLGKLEDFKNPNQ